MKDAEPVVVAARAWDENDYRPIQRILWERTQRKVFDDRGLRRPILYSGSVELECLDCGIRVGVGPRQQSAMAQYHRDGREFVVLCLLCAVFAASDPESEWRILALDNPQDPNTGKIR